MPSTPSAVLFCLVVLAVAVAVAVGLRQAGAGVRPLLAILFAYIAIPGHLARTGALDAWDGTAPPGLHLIAGLGVLTALIVSSAVATPIVDGVTLATIVLLQSFRLVVEYLLNRPYLK